MLVSNLMIHTVNCAEISLLFKVLEFDLVHVFFNSKLNLLFEPAAVMSS